MEYYRPPALQETLEALASIHRALRSWRFYPARHPSRKSSLVQAHSAMLALLDGNDLSLNCGRTGFSFPDGEVLKDTTRVTGALSFELFARRVKKITFLHDLHQEDLLDMVRVLSTTPEAIQQAGGMDVVLTQHGVRTVWINEIDLSIINGRRKRIQESGVAAPPGIDEVERREADPAEELQPEVPDEVANTSVKKSPEQELQELVGQLAVTTDDDLFQLYVRQAILIADGLKTSAKDAAVFPLLEVLAERAACAECSDTLKRTITYALEQLAAGDSFLANVMEQMSAPEGISQPAAFAVLMAAGIRIVPLVVEKIGVVDNRTIRKAFTILLAQMGEPALPALLSMIDDSRWYIVRSICSIVGSIGSVAAVGPLKKCLRHPDIRVGKEVIRSLAKIGGSAAESAIIDVLSTHDSELLPQAISSLGGMKSKKASVALMKIILSDDMFLKKLTIKTEALSALAGIGERAVVPVLLRLLDGRYLLAGARGTQFKVALAVCLGRIGDASALPALTTKATGDGEFAQACAQAVEQIEQLGRKQHGSA